MNVIKPTKFSHWFRLRSLFLNAFPDADRHIFNSIRSRYKMGRTDVWYFEENGNFIGMAVATPGKRYVLLEYVAVYSIDRGKGKSTEIMDSLKALYNNRGIFVEAEQFCEETYNKNILKRRKDFFIKQGFCEQGVYFFSFGSDKELLCWNCSMDFETYYSFYIEVFNLYTACNIRESQPIGLPGRE